jgi:hypothetical protein
MSRNHERLARGEKKRAIASAHLNLIPMGTPASPQERGFAECPCPKDCTLHGECSLCVAYHLRKDQLPRCQR